MKQELLDVVAAGQSREAELESVCVDAPADAGGRWAAKDHLAHLAWWRARAARLIDAARTGAEPPPSVEDDTQNALIYAETKDLAVAAVSENAKAAWQALQDAILACSEEDLRRKHPHAPGSEIWETVPGHAGHIGTHLMWWYLEQGDVERAEAAELWAYGVESEAFPEPAKRADATYNLACFYSRVGQAGRALELLRQSFEAKPDLRELAKRDPDLDAIRGELAPILL
ncbi:MAG: hypothetical protein E6I92_07050 [Chloroflexi bacterium]|nr:MAG: hypothetical protein E6I92_07050 [Chloroflexota bacterium]